MKCAIVYLIKGEAKEYHKKLTRKISKKFNVQCISDKIDPHLTLKYFDQQLDANKLRQVENILDRFVKSHKKSKIKFKGIGNFGRNVLFVDVKPSESFIKTFLDLVKELKKLKWITWLEYDGEKAHFHSTLATEDIEEKFDEIFKFLMKEKPNFNLDFDNITIIIKPRNKWITYREFILK